MASGQLNRNDLKGAANEMLIQNGTGASDRAIDKRIKKLKENRIFCSEKVGKYAIYKLNPEADWEYTSVDLGIKKDKKNKHFTENSIARYLIYKDHTNELKKVIKKWMEELPIVSTEGVRKANYPVIVGSELPFRGSNEIKLSVEIEEEFIFNDLLFHMEKQDKQIIELWNEFKKIYIKYNAAGKALVTEIGEEITQQVNSAITKEISNIKLEVSSGWGINSISERFSSFIFHSCITWADGKMKFFTENYKNFKSHIENKHDSMEYWIEENGYVRIAKDLLEEKKFEDIIDGVMNKIIEKSKVDYFPKGREIVDLIAKLSNLEEQIKKHLKKQLSYPVFKGECDYLKNPILN